MISVKGNLTGKLNTTYTKIYPELENLTVTPSEEQQKFIHEDRYGYDKVVVNPIPDKYIIPSGALDITENGNYNVKEKEFANVNVPTKTLRTKTITTNGTYLAIDDGVDGYSEVEVATNGVDIRNYYSETIGSGTQYGIAGWVNSIKSLPAFTNEGTNCDYMFEKCSPVKTLDLSKFDTSNVTSMGSMFGSCSSLTSLDLSNFNTSNVTNMSGMFNGCSSLTSLDVSSFNTSNVTNMNNMFQNCSSLKSLDLSNFNTSNVTNISWMFQYCSSLKSLDLSNFNTSNVKDMSYMFAYIWSLTNLNISNFDFTKVTNYAYMFNNVPNDCYILVKDATAKDWITSKFTNLTNVHYVGEIE